MARIGIDIDSTLHHYWPLFRRIVLERFGVDLPYERQHTWGTAELTREQVLECIAESHREENVLAGEPYPGAVETVREWHERGHFIHVTSHRATESYAATERWLREIGLAFDDLRCSYDKVARCVELDIDLLVDDSPVNLMRAREAGILAATLRHPWNEHLDGRDGIVVAADWGDLRGRLRPLLG